MSEHIIKERVQAALTAVAVGFDCYQGNAVRTYVNPAINRVIRPALLLTSEAGEVAGKIDKILRDKGGTISDEDKAEIVKEVGDVLWAAAVLLHDMGVSMGECALGNLQKVADRWERGVISGAGDNR